MPIYELAALAAATTWAFTGILAADPAKALGALPFNRVRMSVVFVMLAIWCSLTGSWTTITSGVFPPLLLSGFVGIFLGDTALFLTMNRLGPRRTAILFSTNAPMSVILGWAFLGETLAPMTLAGIALTVAGVMLAILFGKRRDQLHKWEDISGPLWVGVCLGLCAALSQAVGALIARPVMETGAVDPVAASGVRVGIAACALIAVSFYPAKALRAKTAMTWSILRPTALSGMLGMGLGMTLLLFALQGGKVGIITTLSATTPAILLPILWWRTREMPAIGAWFGAALVIAGTYLILNN